MITKTKKIDKIEIIESGHIQIRERTDIIEDGKTINSQFHRYVISPGDNVSSQPDKVKQIAAAVWTPEVLAVYMDSKNNAIK